MLLINGVTGEVGACVADLAHSSGLRIAGLGRNRAKLDELSAKYPEGVFMGLEDISSESEASAILENLRLLIDAPLTQYVHAAALLTRTESPLETTLENFRQTLEANLVGAFVWNKAIMREMISNSTPGSIVNISSQASRTGGYGGTTSYAASKGGLATMTRTFARFGSSHNIRVNSVSPGFIDNAMMNEGLGSKEVKLFEGKTALGRFATNSEVAGVINFLLGPQSSYITGENIEVSGGLSLG
jgi:3-oxoacyl-[acyl-carrier protein] reductase